MPIFEEFPRGGVANLPVINPGEEHLAAVLVIDSSGSMVNVKRKLHEALAAFHDALREDPQAAGTVEICVITFDDTARIAMPFCSVYDFEVPEFSMGGTTSMHEAINLALDEIEARKQQYRASQTSYKRPWIFLLSDGCPTDEDNGAVKRLLEAQGGGHCTFFSVGIGEDADIGFLKTLRPDGMTFSADKQDFKEMFVWLGNSLSITSSSQKNKMIVLPPPPPQIKVEV